TSRLSSALSNRFSPLTPHTQIAPAASPITSPPPGPTKPAAGVMPTSPATAPEIAPSREGRPFTFHSTRSQASTPPEEASSVLKNAAAKLSDAPNAEPALKPNHPTQSKDAPIIAMGRLCGCIDSLP